MTEKTAQKEPGKKPVPSKKPKPQQEVVVQIPLSELHPFPDHPFQMRKDASMQETAESVKEYGVLVPALARPREDGGYELIAGHRRKHACELAGLATMPVIVRDIDRDAATIIMVDSNLQRENILPSERAKAYKMKMEAIKRQGARTDLTSPKISAKFRSDDEVGQDAGVSGDMSRIAMSLLRPRSPYLYVLPSFLSCEEHIACCQFRAAINRLASKCEFDLRGCCQQPAPQCAQRQGSPALSARQTFRVYRYRHWDQNRHRFLRLRRSAPMQASIDSENQNLIS